MTRSFARRLIVFVAGAAAVVGVAFAQTGDGAGKSRFVRTLEGMLSTPDRRVSIDGLEGAFSSNPTVRRITVADAEGVWLELEGVEAVWSRAALLRRTLDIDSLRAERVALLRKPAPAAAPAEPAPASGGGISLPVDIIVDAVTLPEVAIASPVAGMEAHLSIEGSARVTTGDMNARLAVLRKDREGRLSAELRLQPAENLLDANLQFSEPAGGLVAELLRLRGRPAVAVTLSGSGPLQDWRGELQMQADSAQVLAGNFAVSRAGAAYRISGDMAARLETVAPEEYAALLAGESRVAFDVTRGDNGALAVQSATIRSEGIDFSLTGALTADMAPTRGEISLRLGQAGRTTLPFVPGGVSLASLDVTAGLDEGTPAPWRADVSASGLESDFGRVESLALSAMGRAEDLAVPERRSTTFSVGATAEGVAPADAALAAALGSMLRLTGSGSWAAGAPANIESFQAMLAGATASFSGTAGAEGLSGRFAASVTDLSRFSELAQRELAGSSEFQADGSVGLAGDVNLNLDGAATGLSTGIAQLDPLLAGTTRLTGGVARADGRLSFDALTLSNEQVQAELSGSYAAPALDLSVSASVADLASISPRAKGEARLTASLSGTTAAPRVEAEASGEAIELMGQPLTDASARFSGVVAGPDTAGQAEISGALAGVPVRGSAELSAGEGGARVIDDLLLSVGESRVSGDVTIGGDGLISGDVSAVSPDLSKVAPLFLAEARGMLRADVTLSAAGGAQNARFSGTLADIVYETTTLGSAEVQGEAVDLFRQPQIDGTFSVRDLRTGGLHVVSANGTARAQGQDTAITAEARLSDGSASVTAGLAPRGNGIVVSLQALAYQRPGVNLRLAAPTSVVIENGTARIAQTRISVNGGGVEVAGSAGSRLDLTARLSAVPVALANTFSPGLGAEGTISGSATVTGTSAAPQARFQLTGSGVSVAATRNAGLGALGVTADGTFANNRLNLNSAITGADGLSVRVNGGIGTAAGAAMDLSVTGAVPLSLGNRQLAERGAALRGALNVDIRVAGTAANPQFSGRVTSEGGGFIDPATGIVLQNLSLAASVSNNRVVVDRLTARSGEGSVSVTGSIGLTGGFPVDLRAEVRDARYVDGTLLAAQLDADITLTGSFASGTTIAGTVDIDRAEITVPEALPRDSIAVDVRHVNTPPDVQRTLDVAKDRGGSTRGGGGAGRIALDVRINAPQRIFVRGRGLDAELGGELRITGRTSAIVADGAFEMRRGRLDILTQRITFDRGILTFAGDLDPILDFAGSTSSRDITVTITVTGPASDPAVNFSSVPELPQDEVLAHLIFNKGIGDLSPVQIARLATAAVALSGGGGGGGLLEQLRASTGLDDLDIVTDEQGGAALAAGRYISENVYVGVQQGATAESSKVSIDLDITDDVKARAAVSPEGDSSIGIFFERDY
jgi:translocation and assembly module TamB